jgi:hypothetical protein
MRRAGGLQEASTRRRRRSVKKGLRLRAAAREAVDGDRAMTCNRSWVVKIHFFSKRCLHSRPDISSFVFEITFKVQAVYVLCADKGFGSISRTFWGEM